MPHENRPGEWPFLALLPTPQVLHPKSVYHIHKRSQAVCVRMLFFIFTSSNYMFFLCKIFYFEYTDFEELVSAAFAVDPGSESPGSTGSFCLSMAAPDSRAGIQR